MNDDAPQSHVDAYHEKVQQALREEESRRDQAVLLIVGGALALSFPFVASLREHGPIIGALPLFLAWSAWSGALIAALIAYELSISAHRHVLRQLAAGEYDPDKFHSVSREWLERVNPLLWVLTVAGFLLFGWFAAINVTREVASVEKELIVGKAGEVQAEDRQKVRDHREGPTPDGIGAAGAAAELEETEAKGRN